MNKKKQRYTPEQTAMHYGFDFAEIKESSGNKASGERAEEEKLKVLKYYTRAYDLKREIPKSMLFYNKPLIKEKGASAKAYTMGLDVIGVDNALAEAMVIQTALSILKEEGYKDLCIELNSIGDKESVKRFEKELLTYYREKSEILKAPERKKINQNEVMQLFCSSKEYMQEINEDAPKPIYFLSDESSSHFKEVLEYLEGAGLAYQINDSLMGHKNYFSKLIFTISGRSGKEKKSQILARGGRYDELASQTTRKRKISAVGLSMDFKRLPRANQISRKDVSIHLIKIGSNARMKSLDILEAMKAACVPIYHSLDESKISQQLEEAVANKAQYALIIGQQEANRGKVLVRNMETSAQDEVSVAELARYMKKVI
ncbi:MAG: ATP phosphoribosyltransferase regulatory subunit [Patescibacteria group bacterium]